MKLACVRAIAEVARADVSDVVAAAYGRQDIRFGPEYLIPPPFEPRLITTGAPAVAEAAMRSGIAPRPLADLKAYGAGWERARVSYALAEAIDEGHCGLPTDELRALAAEPLASPPELIDPALELELADG